MRRSGKNFLERTALVLAVVIGVLTLNVLASRHFARIDLTEKNLYILAGATKNILQSLEDVVTLHLYFTPELPPTLKGLRRDVEDLLSDFRTYSKNKIRVEYYDPQENPVAEQKVILMGIPPLEVNVVRKDQQELAKIYLGMTVNYGNKQEVLDVVQNVSNLEYRLIAAVRKVTKEEAPVIGWFGPPLPAPDASPQEKGDGFDLILDQLQRHFEVKTLSKENPEAWDPKKIPALLFISSEPQPPEVVTVLTKYMEEGGRLLLFLDHVQVGVGGSGLMPAVQENTLAPLLKSYGIEVKQELVLDASNAAATFTGGVIQFVLPYPFWVRVRPEGFNPEQPMVSELRSLVLPWASPVQADAKPPEGITSAVLFQSTPFGTVTPANPNVPLDPQMAKMTLESGTRKPSTLALLASKKSGEATNSQLLVVGNAAFLKNTFLEQFGENLVFVENALDVLATGGELVGIRSKGSPVKPIAMVKDSERALIKGLDIFLSPLLLSGLGAGVIFWRKKRAKVLKVMYAQG